MAKAKRRLRTIICAAVLLFVGLPAIVVYRQFYYIPPPNVNFRLFGPTWSPVSGPVTDMYILHLFWNISRPHPAELEIEFGTVAGIQEMKNDGSVHAFFRYRCSDQEFNVGDICKTATTPQGQKYRMVIYSDSDHSQEVDWLRGDTLIECAYFTTGGHILSDEEVGRFVDSFVQTSHRGVRVVLNEKAPPKDAGIYH